MWLGFAMTRQSAAQLLRGAVVITGHAVAQAQGMLPSCGEGVRAVMARHPVSAKFTLTHAACQPGEVALPFIQMSADPEAHRLAPEVAGPAAFSLPMQTAATGSPMPVRQPVRRASAEGVQRIVALVPVMDEAARRHDIDPLLLHAIAHVESRHRARAVSHAGARGVMQVMPATARRFGVDQVEALHDAATNVEVSAAYLKRLQRRFGNDLVLVLAAYNAGEGAVERHGRRIPPYRETQAYVRGVLAEYERLRRAVAELRLVSEGLRAPSMGGKSS